ncbi:TlpA disulfide reductase family protein [Microbacter margulisiae]|uniref:Peroxiredoxin n=1 Tax=Microbacter margulisiae TaxID=1350067 RepID=A0A7W5DQ48_9PORP|nr:TlpA disulfide reductase family protein [Microbacter margulisiae]MBB3186916.1 peroxiredoxin [Microbacter margulisiae]
MKKLFFLATAAFPMMLMAQINFSLKGNVDHLNAPAKAYLTYHTGTKTVIDTADINQGAFHFAGKLDEPTQAYIVIDHDGTGVKHSGNDMLPLYLEAGTISVTSTDSVSKAIIAGSELNRINQLLIDQLKPIEAKQKALYNQYAEATPEQRQSKVFVSQIESAFDALDLEQKAIIKKFIKNHPQTIVSLDALKTLGGYTPDYNELEPIFETLSPKVRNTEDAKAYATMLAQLKTVAIGAIAPDFTENDPEGHPVKLSDFRGKYVLLDFWASWCGPCRRENPNVVKAYNEFKGKNFTILSVSLDNENGRQDWLDAIKKDGLTWTQVSDLQYWNNAAAQLYHIRSIPQNFLIDPNGKIIAKDLRGDALTNKLSEIFGTK